MKPWRNIGAWRSKSGATRSERRLATILAASFLCLIVAHAQEKVIPFAYGNLDQWVVRQIKESAIIGGNTKTVYAIGPSQTIVGDEAYHNLGGSPWGTSNVMAKVAGVTKTNTSVFRERRGSGYCARMETRLESVKVLGLVDIQVIAAGSIFLGSVHEPIRSTKNPQSILISGVPFKFKPKAIRFDYKVKTMPEDYRIRSTGFSRMTHVKGSDTAVVVLFLQRRWEDKNGNVYAHRVGTLVHRFSETTSGWINDATFPILYGDISSRSDFKPYMRVQAEERYTINSKGQNVPVKEVDWGSANETPTHMVLQFSSSHGGAYIGSPGTTFWIDNVKLVY